MQAFLQYGLNLPYILNIMKSEAINMMIDTNNLVSLTEGSQNFSTVVQIVDDNVRKAKIDETANKLIEENMEALLELAK